MKTLAVRWQSADELTDPAHGGGTARLKIVVVDARGADRELVHSSLVTLASDEGIDHIFVAIDRDAAVAIMWPAGGGWDVAAVGEMGDGAWLHRVPMRAGENPARPDGTPISADAFARCQNRLFLLHFGEGALASALVPCAVQHTHVAHEVFGIRLGDGSVDPGWRESAADAEWGTFPAEAVA